MKFWKVLPSAVRKFYITVIVVFIVALLIGNPMGSAFVTSLTSQEFVLAHIKDIVQAVSGPEDETDFRLVTGTYEETLDGELFGIAEGKNLIMIQFESVQEIMIRNDYYGQEITPFFNSLIEDESSIYFSNFYHQIGSGNTSDAEFVSNNSLIGSIESYTYQLYEDNYFKGLPWILKEKGYNTNVFHGYKKEFWNRENIYPTLGFDTFYSADDFESDNIAGIGGGNIVGISDSAFYKQTIEHMKKLPQPFYGFVITLSSHNPFYLPDSLIDIELKPQDQNLVGRYIQSVNFADRCLEEFFNGLKESGLYEDSIILIYGDHFGLSRADSDVTKVTSDWLGHDYTYDEMMRVPFLIHIPGEDVNEEITISGGQMDIMPTACYLLGVEELDTLYLGKNLLTADEGDLVAFQMHMLKGSFIKDDVVFEMSRDGVFENSNVYDRLTRSKLDPSDYYEEYIAAKEKIELSKFYLENDVLRLAIEEGKNAEQISMALSGEKNIEEDLNGYSIAVGDEIDKDSAEAEIIDEMYKEIIGKIAADDDFYVALSSDSMLKLLTYIGNTYSGKDGKTGTILSVDEEASVAYESFKTHVYPVITDVSEITKIDYLGYENLIIAPDMSEMTREQFIALCQTHNPVGVLLDAEELAAYSGLAKGLGLTIYCEYDGNIEEHITAKRYGAEGKILL